MLDMQRPGFQVNYKTLCLTQVSWYAILQALDQNKGNEMVAEIMRAFWSGVSEETMCRIFDLPYAELIEIIIHN